LYHSANYLTWTLDVVRVCKVHRGVCVCRLCAQPWWCCRLMMPVCRAHSRAPSSLCGRWVPAVAVSRGCGNQEHRVPCRRCVYVGGRHPRGAHRYCVAPSRGVKWRVLERRVAAVFRAIRCLLGDPLVRVDSQVACMCCGDAGWPFASCQVASPPSSGANPRKTS
jgi:hypothetical protein